MDTRRRYAGGFNGRKVHTKYSYKADFSQFYDQTFLGRRSSENRQRHSTTTVDEVEVPSWEKRFCAKVGLISWEKFLEGKKYMHIFKNVVDWNDSAGEEAFRNAKSRFWARINYLPCDIPLPDPDTYINDIDWNSDADPESILELEGVPDSHDQEAREDDDNGLILNNSLQLNQNFSCVGWGNEADFPTPQPYEPITEWGNEGGFPKPQPFEATGDRRTRNRDSRKMSKYKTSKVANDENPMDRGGSKNNKVWKKKSSNVEWRNKTSC
ncbi:hypothetical protein Ddye_011774 [Dipteronia dyeriana]|uniref:Uncharacterized protein n=1 Tax=Dipteronia dyeriana TaxID=168575 RepID=A0AAD9X328_9ROSI|nr:hypothetical protein Ddye_011774 [Dipteronia dyeriana]